MPLVSMGSILRTAYEKRYAVGAFNVVNLEFIEAVFETAERLGSPVIVSIAEVHLPFVNVKNVCPMIRSMAQLARVPAALHFDHGLSLETIRTALDHGFTSVMFDGSKLPFEENVRRTREVVERCRTHGVTVEAELGAVGGDEGGRLESEADPSLFTDPEAAARFVAETGVDALAVAVGNAHGKYKGEPRLDFDRLQRIDKLCGVPLVLHGGSGIGADDFRRAVALGIAKINIYTSMSQAALQTAEDFVANSSGRYHDFPMMMRKIKEAVAETVAEQMAVFGSMGRCPSA